METVRSFVRDLFGYRSFPYRLGSAAITFTQALYKGGVSGLGVAFMGQKTGPGRWVTVRGLLHPIFIRPGTEDVSSVLNNVFREEYGQLSDSLTPYVIVDAGAYIGDTSAYFLSRFEQAKVIALEPNADNFALAVQNLANYGARVQLLNVALCGADGFVRISGASTGSGVSDVGDEVKAVSMATLLRDFGIASVDILKMDIEGSEADVLSDSADWLAKVKFLLLETHGGHIEAAVLPVLKRRGFTTQRIRNVWYCRNTGDKDPVQ
jgi:FkbM family methyltransferase